VHGVFPSSRLICRIFTENSISLEYCWRQQESRYTIRAGQNLPDKEFRYLRTVMVTAAVYWGLNSKRELLLFTFQHRAGVKPYTAYYNLAESCVFIKQSLSSRRCDPLNKIFKWHSFSRSYRANLPSSFNIILPLTLVYSTSLPESVLSTVKIDSNI